ncbi:hypothetical protein [Mucilaginibacter sp.]|nr:hypothetical protein [Mucilaginibacter sp.]
MASVATAVVVLNPLLANVLTFPLKPVGTAPPVLSGCNGAIAVLTV